MILKNFIAHEKASYAFKGLAAGVQETLTLLVDRGAFYARDAHEAATAKRFIGEHFPEEHELLKRIDDAMGTLPGGRTAFGGTIDASA